MGIRTRERIIGIDFSGPNDACKKFWLTEGAINSKTLVIDRCTRAGNFLNLEKDSLITAQRRIQHGRLSKTAG